MNTKAQDNIQQAMRWLAEDVLPLWLREGIDATNGGFEENLSDEGKAISIPRRAMAQARQIYSFTEAYKLRLISETDAKRVVENGAQYLLKNYTLPSGAFIHTVDAKGNPVATQSELYTQAFVLFALARAYEFLRKPELSKAAKKLLIYLETERKNKFGGYTEIKNGQVVFQSNPHMHLFEALIEWIRVTPLEPQWRTKALEIFELCETKFINPGFGGVCEYFSEKWEPLQENGKIVFEPGHQFEWAWLMLQYERHSSHAVGTIPHKLYHLAEKHGVNPQTGFVYDELWSDLTIKSASSRFWPQCERIKTSVDLGLRAPKEMQNRFARSADQALQSLNAYFTKPLRGLWQDTRLEDGGFTNQAAKSSSLYHIMGALSEYAQKRPQLQD